jgi:hypothetical protein
MRKDLEEIYRLRRGDSTGDWVSRMESCDSVGKSRYLFAFFEIREEKQSS